MKYLVLLLMVCLLLAQGCAEIIYDELQTKQRSNCYKKNDPIEVQECLKNSNMPYEEYEKIRKDDKK